MRYVRLLVVLAPVSLTSCIPIPYAYPTLDHTPAFSTEAPADEVIVIRADLKEYRSGAPFSRGETRSFKPIALKADSRIDSQYLPGVRNGVLWHLIALDYSWYTRHRVQVCLYRRGYQTLHVGSESDAFSIRWMKAATLQEQELAIDLVHLSRWELPRVERDASRRAPADKIGSILPGSSSPEHCKVLLFLATEYERLSLDLPEGSDLERLTSKANSLRARAAD